MKDRVLFYNDTTLDNHYGSELTSLILKQAIRKYASLVKEIPVGVPWQSSDLHKVSTVIINGEGSFHDVTLRTEYIYSLACYAKSLNKRVCLINASIYNIPEYYDFNVFDVIYTREGMSFETAKNRVSNSANVFLNLDVVFAYDEYPKSTERGGFMVNDSVIPDVAKSLYKIFSEEHYEDNPIRYVPLIRNNYFNTFYNVLKQYTEVKHVITGRYHGVCFALMTGTPFVAVESNIPKIRALAAEFGVEDRVFDSVDDARSSGKQFEPLEVTLNPSDSLHKVEEMIKRCLVNPT